MSSSVDLTNCDTEPIHIPGSIQAHGFLLGLEATSQGGFKVSACSENVQTYLHLSPAELLGRELASLAPSQLGKALGGGLVLEGMSEESARFMDTVHLPDAAGEGYEFQIVGHRRGALFILEFERIDHSITQAELNEAITNFVAPLEEQHDSSALCQTIAAEVRELTGFDRVLLYRFDEEGHGIVLAEDRNDRLPSYLGLRFPASDIPRQARALYVSNRIRIIPNVDYEPSPLLTVPSLEASLPLDLSLSILRSVSPVHREYMRNMGTVASMSISIISDGQLWGLISAHHSEPRTVPYLVRSACDVLSRILSAQLKALERASAMSQAIELKSVHGQLLTFMAGGEGYIEGLVRHPEELFAVTGAASAAVLVGERCVLLGDTPSEADVLELADWVSKRGREEVFATSQLGHEYARGKEFQAKASGVLAVSLSQVHRMQILWFRPEVITTVQWAGEPAKDQDALAGVVRIHPRNSFASWKQTVQGRSSDWSAVEIDSAREFRNSVLEIVLKRAEELASMAAELEISNKELEAFSYSVSHDLRAPFRHISGFAELLVENESGRLSETGRRHLNTIAQSAQFAGLLVDSLLNFSKITRTTLDLQPISMGALVEGVWREVKQQELQGRTVTFSASELPTVLVDLGLLRQVWRNLLSNSAKYTRTRADASVSVGVEEVGGEYVFSVTDNGVGFEGKYAHKLFGAFQRLHRMEDFEGTGIGLANVRRIVARHGGRTWAVGEEGRGATFFFSLPIQRKCEM